MRKIINAVLKPINWIKTIKQKFLNLKKSAKIRFILICIDVVAVIFALSWMFIGRGLSYSELSSISVLLLAIGIYDIYMVL